MKKVKQLYNEVRNHNYRHMRLKEDAADYYETLYALTKAYGRYAMDPEKRDLNYKFWQIIAHDTYTELGRACNRAKMDMEINDDLLIACERFLMYIHSVIDNGEPSVAYTYYSGANYLGTKENPVRWSKWVVRGGEVRRVFNKRDKEAAIIGVIKRVEDYKEKVKNEKSTYYDMWLKYLSNAERNLEYLQSEKSDDNEAD